MRPSYCDGFCCRKGDAMYPLSGLSFAGRGATMRRVSAIKQRNATASERLTVDAATARERFERRIGSVDLGQATGADNESIDAGLAREYATTDLQQEIPGSHGQSDSQSAAMKEHV